MTHRFFLELCFKGTNYHGWQVQPNATSVQRVVNNALSTILKNDIGVVGAGRTDTGVHASFFIAHFDTEISFSMKQAKERFLKSLNAVLPYDIAIRDVYEVTPEAHARFSVLKRTYEYTIITEKNPFMNELAWYIGSKMDLIQMNRCAASLLQYDDFTSFSRLHSGSKTNLCKIFEAYWTEKGSKLIFSITADRFLRNMVRAIVGTMIDVGKGKTDTDGFKKIIEKKNRGAAGASAPAKGLVLTNLEYPVEIKKT